MVLILARSVLTFGCLMVVGSLLMLLLVSPGTGEYVITVTTLVLGGLLLAGAAIALRRIYTREAGISGPSIDPAGDPADQKHRTRSGPSNEEEA